MPEPEIQRELIRTYRNFGTYLLPDAARRAHKLTLSIRIDSITRTQYQNFKYNPPQGDYGNVTLFHGFEVAAVHNVKFANEVIYEWFNLEGSLVQATYYAQYLNAENLVTIAAALGRSVSTEPPESINLWGCPLSLIKILCPAGTQFSIRCEWYEFQDQDVINVSPSVRVIPPPNRQGECREPTKREPPRPWRGNPPKTPDNPADCYLGDGNDQNPDDTGEPPPAPPATWIAFWMQYRSYEGGANPTTNPGDFEVGRALLYLSPIDTPPQLSPSPIPQQITDSYSCFIRWVAPNVLVPGCVREIIITDLREQWATDYIFRGFGLHVVPLTYDARVRDFL